MPTDGESTTDFEDEVHEALIGSDEEEEDEEKSEADEEGE